MAQRRRRLLRLTAGLTIAISLVIGPAERGSNNPAGDETAQPARPGSVIVVHCDPAIQLDRVAHTT